MSKTFAIGGIHPAPNKIASPLLELQPLPMTAVLPLSQHIGAPATPVVKRGDHVTRGQEIATNPAFISAGLHAPITGTVATIEPVVMPNGKPSTAIIIKATEEEHQDDTEARTAYWQSMVPGQTERGIGEGFTAAELREKISASGIVGLGGAAFPTSAKLTLRDRKADTLIINCCECEPYLMCDDALARTYPARIVEGIELIMKAAEIPHAVLAIEDNKPEAAAALRKAIGNLESISLEVLRTRYPQGGEKQLIQAVTGRRVPSGALPLAVGVIVHNVATAFAVWQAIDSGVPLIERVVTITGDIPAGQRRNYIAAIGTPLSEFEFTLPDHPKVIVGGPMMGRTAVRLDAPLTKALSGLTILRESRRGPVEACIRCGKCVEACPMGLEPYLLATYGRLRMWEDARDNLVADCLECGSCSYVCPANRPILDFIRIAKQRSKNIK